MSERTLADLAALLRVTAEAHRVSAEQLAEIVLAATTASERSQGILATYAETLYRPD